MFTRACNHDYYLLAIAAFFFWDFVAATELTSIVFRKVVSVLWNRAVRHFQSKKIHKTSQLLTIACTSIQYKQSVSITQ